MIKFEREGIEELWEKIIQRKGQISKSKITGKIFKQVQIVRVVNGENKK